MFINVCMNRNVYVYAYACTYNTLFMCSIYSRILFRRNVENSTNVIEATAMTVIYIYFFYLYLLHRAKFAAVKTKSTTDAIYNRYRK